MREPTMREPDAHAGASEPTAGVYGASFTLTAGHPHDEELGALEDFHVPATINHLRDLTRHEWALVITAVVTLAAIAALALIALGKGWL